ncbi:MAG: hypothetical protein EOM26_09000 [Alphaproteobacteria bacterium]|nr:hypothetical protein [Alphaproteobacteria bacterium]
MSALAIYFARKALERLDLSDTYRQHAQRLLQLAESDDRIQVARVQAELFPLNTPASANTALQRLLKAINEAAQGAGSPLRAAITSGKKLGPTQRWVWFEGPISDPAPPETGELNAIPPGQLVPDQRGMPAEGCPVVVLLTFNQHETTAVLGRFHPQGNPPVQTRNGMTYNLLGTLHGMRVVHRVSKQGEGEAQNAAHDAIRDWNPNAVIAVGIAFGVNPTKQAIGDVLVSQCIRGYELGRVNADGTFDLRGDKPSASPVLYNRLDTLNQRRESNPATGDAWPKVRFGTLLSGNRLVDNLDYRMSLLALEQEAIGGEMEAVGIQLAADRHKVDWIIVKAICDWGDGNKGAKSKEHDQALAARNAALVIHAALALGSLYDRPRPPPDGPPPDPSRRAPWRDPDAEAMGVQDLALIPTRQRIEDARGLAASLHKDLDRSEGPDPDTPGLPVMETLLDWVDQPDAPPYFALLGEYGMGKTVSCQRLAVALRDRRREDPTRPLGLYFDLRNLTGVNERVPRLKEVVEECMARGWLVGGGEGLDLPAFEGWLDQGAVVIFDGLDEALVKLSEPDGQSFTRELLRLEPLTRQRQREAGVIRPNTQDGAGPRLRILVSCRTQYFRTLRDQQNHFTGQERGDRGPDAFRAMVLLPLHQDQVRRYLAGTLPGTDTDALLETIASVHNLTELTQRPYTLKLVSEFIPAIEVDRLAGRPVYGVTLYRRMVERWLERDAGKHHIRPEHKLRLAAHLAAHLWREGSGLLPADAIEPWFHEWRESEPDLRRRYANLHPDQLEEDLRTATFLARQDETDDKGIRSSFRFAHTSLLEYFLADYLLQALSDDAPQSWAMKRPSLETLDFLGQRLAEADDPALIRRLSAWRTAYRPQISELLLDYALRAYGQGWPMPDLRGIALPGANLTDYEFRSLPDRSPLDLSRANFTGARLHRARFEGVRLKGAIFHRALIYQCCFLDSEASNTTWTEAQCTAATWKNTGLLGAQWAGAHGYRPKFFSSTPIPSDQFNSIISGPLNPALQFPPDDVRLHWLRPHSGPQNFCVFSPNGLRVLCAGGYGTLTIWDVKDGQLLQCWNSHHQKVLNAAFSPDGLDIVSAGEDGNVRLWNSGNNLCIDSINVNGSPIRACAFANDGRRFVIASEDGVMQLWDASTRTTVFEAGVDRVRYRQCHISPSGLDLLCIGDSGAARLYDLASGKCIRTFSRTEKRAMAGAYSPDGEYVAIGFSDGTMSVIDAESWSHEHNFAAHGGPITCCAFSPDSTRLLSGSSDGEFCLYCLKTQELIADRTFEQTPIFSCHFSPDGATVLYTQRHANPQLIDSLLENPTIALGTQFANADGCQFSPDGELLLFSHWIGRSILWDVASGHSHKVVGDFSGRWSKWQFSYDGSSIMAIDESWRIAQWDTKTGYRRDPLGGSSRQIRDFAISSNGFHLATIQDDCVIRLSDARLSEIMWECACPDRSLMNCSFSRDCSMLISGGLDGKIRAWSVQSGEAVLEVDAHEGAVWGCQISPEGDQLISAGWDGRICRWDVHNGTRISTIDGGHGWILDCRFSPDGYRVASCGDDGTVRLWGARHLVLERTLRGHQSRVIKCSFSPDGKLLASVGLDGLLLLWDVESGELLRAHASAGAGYVGHAVWEPGANRIVEATGDMWRWLHWVPERQTDPDHGNPTLLPLDHYGPPPSPAAWPAADR